MSSQTKVHNRLSVLARHATYLYLILWSVEIHLSNARKASLLCQGAEAHDVILEKILLHATQLIKDLHFRQLHMLYLRLARHHVRGGIRIPAEI